MKKLMILITGAIFTQITLAQEPFRAGGVLVSENYGGDWNTATMHFQMKPENSAQMFSARVAASEFNLVAEYGLFNWLGVGIMGRVDNFYVNENTFIKTVPSMASEDAGVTANIHFPVSRRLDTWAGADCGFSQLSYNVNDVSHNMISGYGTWADIHAGSCFYFGQFGIDASLYSVMTDYNDLKSSQSPAGEYLISSWKSYGYGASIGLLYRAL